MTGLQKRPVSFFGELLEWPKGTVCKTDVQWFESTTHLKFFDMLVSRVHGVMVT
jgi:hypothetical protein